MMKRTSALSFLSRRPVLRRIATAGLLSAAVLPTASCLSLIGVDQGMVTITNAYMATSVGQGCQSNIDIANGVLDLNVQRPYVAALNLRTNLPATVNTGKIQQDQQRNFNFPSYGPADSNIVTIDRAYVYIKDGSASERVFSITNPATWTPPSNDGDIADLPTFDRPRVTAASGVVFNEQTSLGGARTIFVPAITAREASVLFNGPIRARLQAGEPITLIANITLEGVTSGAGYVRSNEFSLPIDLCLGCLVSEPVCTPPEVLQGANCALVGQDLPASCAEPTTN